MTLTDEGRERWTAAVLTVVFGAVACLAAADLVGDAGSDASPVHLAVEGAVLPVWLAGSLWMAVRFRALASERRAFTLEGLLTARGPGGTRSIPHPAAAA